jgi:hypothetical protein
VASVAAAVWALVADRVPAVLRHRAAVAAKTRREAMLRIPAIPPATRPPEIETAMAAAIRSKIAQAAAAEAGPSPPVEYSARVEHLLRVESWAQAAQEAVAKALYRQG